MSWTSDDLSALDKAIKKGATTVKFKDYEITYRSLDEMLRLRRLMQRELGVSPKKKRVTPTFSKGLCGGED